MHDMASQAQTVAAYATSTLAIVGGMVAQAAPNPGVGDAGLYVGAGGLAAALALLVSSMGDKLGPHIVAIAKLLVENRAINIKLKGENLTLASRILEQDKRLTDLEAALVEAREKADKAEDLALELKLKANARFKAVDARMDEAHRKADDTATRLDVVEGLSGSGEIPTSPAPSSPPSPSTPPGTGR